MTTLRFSQPHSTLCSLTPSQFQFLAAAVQDGRKGILPQIIVARNLERKGMSRISGVSFVPNWDGRKIIEEAIL